MKFIIMEEGLVVNFFFKNIEIIPVFIQDFYTMSIII